MFFFTYLYICKMVKIYCLFCFAFLIPFSLQKRENMVDLISWQALHNLYILPIFTTDDIITQNECSMETTMKCMLNSFLNFECFSNIYNERLLFLQNSSNNEFLLLANKKPFFNSLKKCSINEIKKINFKNSAISKQSNLYPGNMEQAYPKCVENITQCLNAETCIIPSQYNIMDKIINICSDFTFKNLNLSFKPSKPIPTSFVDEMESLAKKEIGHILDPRTITILPQKYIDIFGNLTYEKFDAFKMLSATIPILKQFFCDSQENQFFESIEPYIVLSQSPQLPENVKHFFKTLTSDEYLAVKYMLKIYTPLRWSFCSPIFAISPSKELTNIYSQPATLWALQNCRGIADQNIMTHSAVCEGSGLLFG